MVGDLLTSRTNYDLMDKCLLNSFMIKYKLDIAMESL